MNKKETLSALIDGELEGQEVTRLLSNWSKEDDRQWSEMAFIADGIRATENLETLKSGFTSRFSEMLEREPVVIAPRALPAVSKGGLGLLKFRNIAVAASVVLVGIAIQKTSPPLETQVQMVKAGAEVRLTDEQLALWQDYFMAHQRHSMNGGVPKVSPIDKLDSDQPMAGPTERVIASTSAPADWMKIWEPVSQPESGVIQYQYVGTSR